MHLHICYLDNALHLISELQMLMSIASMHMNGESQLLCLLHMSTRLTVGCVIVHVSSEGFAMHPLELCSDALWHPVWHFPVLMPSPQ